MKLNNDTATATTPLLVRKDGNASSTRKFSLGVVSFIGITAVLGTSAVFGTAAARHFAKHPDAPLGAVPSSSAPTPSASALAHREDDSLNVLGDAVEDFRDVHIDGDEPTILDTIRGHAEEHADAFWSPPPKGELDEAFVEEFYRVTGYRLDAREDGDRVFSGAGPVADLSLPLHQASSTEYDASMKYLEHLKHLQRRDAEVIARHAELHGRKVVDEAASGTGGDEGPGELGASSNSNNQKKTDNFVTDVMVTAAKDEAYSAVMKEIRIQVNDDEQVDLVVASLDSFFEATEMIAEAWDELSCESLSEVAVNRAVNNALVMDAIVSDAEKINADIHEVKLEMEKMEEDFYNKQVALHLAKDKLDSKKRLVRLAAEKTVEKLEADLDKIQDDYYEVSRKRRNLHNDLDVKMELLPADDVAGARLVADDAMAKANALEQELKSKEWDDMTPENRVDAMEHFIAQSDIVVDECGAPEARPHWSDMTVKGAKVSYHDFKTRIQSPDYWKGVTGVDLDNPAKNADVFGTVGSAGEIVNAIDPFSGPEFCWLDSKTRGVGKIPNKCPNGKEKIGLLCYDKCPNGWDRVGVDCHQRCKSGDTDIGLMCGLGNFHYNRGGGSGQNCNWYGGNCKCPSSKPSKCGFAGGCCYKRCPSSHPNSHVPLCHVCSKTCSSSGYEHGNPVNHMGSSACAKRIIFSPGLSELQCPSNMEKDAGLCYPKCGSAYKGVGPVCWGSPPKNWGMKGGEKNNWVNCGMGAAKDSGACGGAIAGQVMGPMEVAVFVATAGGSSAATAGKASDLLKKFPPPVVKACDDLFALMSKAATKLPDMPTVKKIMGQAAEILGSKPVEGGAGLAGLIQGLANVQSETDLTRLLAEFMSIFDPTGAASVIAAYTFDTCANMMKDYS